MNTMLYPLGHLGATKLECSEAIVSEALACSLVPDPHNLRHSTTFLLSFPLPNMASSAVKYDDVLVDSRWGVK